MDYQQYLTLTGKPWLPSQKTFGTWHDDGMRRVRKGTRLLWLPYVPIAGRHVHWRSRLVSERHQDMLTFVPLPDPGVYTVLELRAPQETRGSGGWPMYRIEYIPEGFVQPLGLWVYWHDMNVVNYDLMTQSDAQYYLEILCREIPVYESQRDVLRTLYDAYVTSIAMEHVLLMRVVDSLYQGWETECPVTRVQVLDLCQTALTRWKHENDVLRPLTEEDVKAWKAVRSRALRRLRATLSNDEEEVESV